MKFLAVSSAIEQFMFVLCTRIHKLSCDAIHKARRQFNTIIFLSQEREQCARKGRKEEKCKLVNMNGNNAGFKVFVFANVFADGFNAFVRPPGYTQCVLV